MWRESIFPLGCEANPKPDSPFLPNLPHAPNYDDCVVKREQAPSPQACISGPTVRLCLMKLVPRVDLSLTEISDGFRSPNENMTDTANRQFWQNPPALRFMVAVRGRPLGLPSLSLLLGLRTRSQPPPICFAAKRWLFYPRGLF